MATAAPTTPPTSSASGLPDLRGISLSALAMPDTPAAGAVACVVARIVGDADDAGQVSHFTFNSTI